MGIFDYFCGKIVEEKKSSFNGRIKVVKQGNDYRLEAGGLLQSGGLVKKIWQTAITNLKNEINHCLILGLGGGTAVKLINQKWPKSQTTAIEIDPVMIGLAKKYFLADNNLNLKIIEADAIKWIGDVKENYNLILVDLYLGDQFPEAAASEEFLDDLKRILTNKGVAIFNRLFWGEKKKEAKNFVKKLENHFDKITLKRTPCNLLILCSN